MEPILTALDGNEQLVRIDDAIRGGRYMGTTQDHLRTLMPRNEG